ncbi:gliding motility-associated C-terminal domain-containing protein [Hyunsoonleella jejuensis]|uniref:Gliding motility-associated C-terminal domain-containing protein n=1 Tax=Hyunsoonleella jejuensis TaxID=419940 RepID=A0A1H9JJ08_9FLAO|nr:choice-of-anchor L domain-containing protein [Hyunsoonleella jejuensis]SEQ86816.1 gliding motility-associated C-terminal domain-containing protein [Hyunsoonleella jejuensis]
MKNFYFLSIIFTLFFNTNVFPQQITTDSSIPLEQLILNNLAQGCVEISNISSNINGSINNLESYGYFEKGSSAFPFENGIVLSTGNVNSAGNTINTTTLNEGEENWGTDADLENALGIINTLNATTIEFDFVSFSNQIQFNYLLASEEYYLTNPCSYSDGFAFLIKEAGTIDPYENIALIPGTNTPVNTTTIREEVVGFCPAQNEAYFQGNNQGDTNFNGRTTVLTANASIIPNVKYHIKLVIADQDDQNFDSAVFIEGNSFNASVNLGDDISTCANNVDLNADINNSLATYAWYLDGIVIPGADTPNLTATTSGNYKVEITIGLNNSSCVIDDEIAITLNGEQISGDITNFILCDDNSNDGVESFDLDLKYYEILYSVPSGSYNISYHLSEDDARNNANPITSPYSNTSNPQLIYVRIQDINNGCIAYPTFNLIVNEAPTVTKPQPILVCDDLDNDGFKEIDLSQSNNEITGGDNTKIVTYHYSQQDADSGFFPIYSFYTNINPTDNLFVRVYDSFSGCHATTTIDVTVQPNPDINISDRHWINACEENSDGIAEFDLTTALNSILNGVTGATTTFHLNEADALNGVNAITNETAFTNTTEFYQLLYVRVYDETTGCFSMTTLELQTNLVEFGIDYNSYEVCDDISNDGIEDFDLNSIEEDIKGEYGDINVVFYESQDDLDNQTNPLDESIPITVTSSPKTLYTTVIDDICKVNVLVSLIINPALELPDIDSVDYCDTDTDGYTSIILDTFNSDLTEGVSPVSIEYYLNEVDAQNDENRLPPTFYNYYNPQTIYTRISNPQSGCVAIKPLEINIITAPIVNYPQSIIVCDDDQDAFSVVDLTAVAPDIVTDLSDVEITYYDNYWRAFNGEEPLENPESFNATNQYAYFRVESKTTSCFNISYVYINVNTLPIFPEITIFENCESGTDDIADFYFYQKDNEILNGQWGKQVLYFETEQDAINRTNEIDKYNIYQNTSNPQTIYTRVESFTDPDCYGTSSFALEVGSIPLFNEPENIIICDDISNDGVELFDLNSTIDHIKEGINDNLNITLHTSAYDAEFGYNPIDPLFTNYVNPQPIYVRISNGTYCHGITDFTLSIVQVPVTTQPSPLVLCDVDYDGVVTFDITESELQILDVRQNNLVISYHKSQEGVDNHNEIITDPENYTNTSNPETVYIKINNTISNCSVSLPIELQVDLPPAIEEFETYEICDNPSKYFNLNDINQVIVPNDADAIITYYSTAANAEAGIMPLSTNYNYNTTNDNIFIRVESATRGCHYVYPFQLIVNPLPIANQPLDMEACDDVIADGFEIFDLSLQKPSILGGQLAEDFNITFHETNEEALNDTNALDENYNAQNGQDIYVRIENKITGCFSTTEFSTIVHNYPNQVNPITLCDVDYDETVVFDISANQNNVFPSPSSNIIISYFDDENLLNDDTAAIKDPKHYTNISNPQTIYVKVFNVSANCYNVINQELIVTSPPAIEEFQTYEICDNPSRYFNLNNINQVIVPNDADAIITYYSNAVDAEAKQTPLSTDYTYNTTNDTIYIRIESSTRGCHYVYPFQLVVNPLPVAHQPLDMEVCDNDYDNRYKFNLSNQNHQILGAQSPNEFTVTYYASDEDANSKENNHDNFYEIDTEEKLFARVENNQTGCYSITSFMAYVRRKPVNDIGDQVICLENFPLMVTIDTGFEEDTYAWEPFGQTTADIVIEEIGEYSVTVTTKYGCSTTKTFNVIESEQANIEFTETVDFSDPNNITITVSGIGDYLYQLDDREPQISNFFQNVPIGPRLITVIDINGCTSISKEVVVIDTPKFLTPNNDGYFDTWHITGVEQLEGTIIHIYDQYGKLIKSLAHNSPGWDGTYNGHHMPSNDYWFAAHVYYKGDEFDVKGHFTLKR